MVKEKDLGITEALPWLEREVVLITSSPHEGRGTLSTAHEILAFEGCTVPFNGKYMTACSPLWAAAHQ